MLRGTLVQGEDRHMTAGYSANRQPALIYLVCLRALERLSIVY